MFSAVIFLIVNWLRKIRIDILWQHPIFKCIGFKVIFGQAVEFNFITFSFQEIVESPMLSPGLALIPVVYFFKTHVGCHFFCFDALSHSLKECIAGMRLHVYRVKWLHINK